MANKTLFSSATARLDNREKSYGESSFQFLDRCSWPLCSMIRGYVNQHIELLLSDNEFMSRFQSKDDQQHDSAMFEFLVYNLFKSLGFSLSKHPDLPNGKRPDFMLLKNSLPDIILECTLSGYSFEERAIKKQKEAVEAIIDKMDYFPYWINVHFENSSPKSISSKELVKFITNLSEKVSTLLDEQLPLYKFPFESNGWTLKISFFRKTDPKIKKSKGIIDNGAKMINHIKPCLSALNGKKGTRYGEVNIPYVICLANNDLFFKEEDLCALLFGYGHSNRIILDERSGYFWERQHPINTSVSGILLFKNFHPYTLDHSRISLWCNPFAKNPLRDGLRLFDNYSFEYKEDTLLKNFNKVELDIFKLLGFDKVSYLENKANSKN